MALPRADGSLLNHIQYSGAKSGKDEGEVAVKVAVSCGRSHPCLKLWRGEKVCTVTGCPGPGGGSGDSQNDYCFSPGRGWWPASGGVSTDSLHPRGWEWPWMKKVRRFDHSARSHRKNGCRSHPQTRLDLIIKFGPMSSTNLARSHPQTRLNLIHHLARSHFQPNFVHGNTLVFFASLHGRVLPLLSAS